MNKDTESLISACHELARTAKCDDYLILNDIADKLKSLSKERDKYMGMFIDSCAGLAAIADAVGIREEDDTGSPGQVIAEIRKIKANAIQEYANKLISE
ncbi:glutamyl-tRNA amidotransferase [Photorhabdus sp. P32]|uniref:glutamyl-tRNA amidotransferase n=1 Tax=Photorhabdus sp. P32 TaxID=3117549 RepID=UPI00311AD0F6